jgi:hypothetical protein
MNRMIAAGHFKFHLECEKRKYIFFFLMSRNLSKAGPSDPPLQSKPRSRAPHPRKFSYTELVKSLAFHQGVWPQGIVCTHEELNLGP